jgi:predicted nuclease of predicted toxin-antitoxin system
MRFVADESLDHPIVNRLRADGHDVWSVAESAPSLTDDSVLTEANRREALLVTADKDFGELVFHLRRVTTGVILIRLAGLSAQTKAELVAKAVAEHTTNLAGAFTVVTRNRIRIRRTW